jgi:hypothetical protein
VDDFLLLSRLSSVGLEEGGFVGPVPGSVGASLRLDSPGLPLEPLLADAVVAGELAAAPSVSVFSLVGVARCASGKFTHFTTTEQAAREEAVLVLGAVLVLISQVPDSAGSPPEVGLRFIHNAYPKK